MKYKITSADRALGQIQVVYFDDSGKQLVKYCIDLQVENGLFPTGQALEQVLEDHSPKFVIAREKEVANATNFSDIEALVEPMPDEAIDPQEIENALMWEYENFKSKVARVLVDMKLLTEDPTQIGVTKL